MRADKASPASDQDFFVHLNVCESERYCSLLLLRTASHATASADLRENPETIIRDVVAVPKMVSEPARNSPVGVEEPLWTVRTWPRQFSNHVNRDDRSDNRRLPGDSQRFDRNPAVVLGNRLLTPDQTGGSRPKNARDHVRAL